MTPNWEYFADLEELIWLGYKRVGDPTWWSIQEAMGEKALMEIKGSWREERPASNWSPCAGDPAPAGAWMDVLRTGMTHAGQFLSLGGDCRSSWVWGSLPGQWVRWLPDWFTVGVGGGQLLMYQGRSWLSIRGMVLQTLPGNTSPQVFRQSAGAQND